jgi:hypothetical protein
MENLDVGIGLPLVLYKIEDVDKLQTGGVNSSKCRAKYFKKSYSPGIIVLYSILSFYLLNRTLKIG